MRHKDFVMQKDSMQCGIACLAMICRILGVKYSMEFLSRYCHATIAGVSMLGIKEASDKIGLNATGILIDIEHLKTTQLPVILHWNQNHYVVLHRISKKRKNFHIADPAKGLYELSEEEFLKYWHRAKYGDEEKGIAMHFIPNADFGKIKDDTLKVRRSFSFLLEYLFEYKKYFIQIGVGLLLGCLLQLAMPFLTQSIVDIGIRDENIGFIWLVLFGEFMIVVGRTATDFIRRWLLLHISMRINISLLSDFFIKLLKLPMSFFDTKLTGDLLQRMGDHERTQSFLTGQVLNILFSLLSFLIFGIALYIYDTTVFVVFMTGTIVYATWITIFLHKRKILDYELFETTANKHNQTWQFITMIQEIKLQDCERRRRLEWEDAQADLFEVQMKSLKLQQSQEAGSIFINEIKNILITFSAASAVIKGDMTLGGMLAIQYMVGQLNSPVSQMMSFVYSLQDVKISLERINEIHLRKNEENASNKAEKYVSNKDIRFENVDFKYNPHSIKKTLTDISIIIPEGKVTAIVGASGSGKTTLIKLMLGYYPSVAGKIMIADLDINEYNLKWWRRQCGVVMQDGSIFSESIERNIAVDDSDVDRKRLEEAARIACIHDYVMKLPLKYDTKIGRDGVGLSQGQKQRILIARAVYRNPDYIFLDEATNSLDAINEKEIIKNLDIFYKGKTVVVVAHRLSTVRNADQIVVLDEGRIIETGTHDQLSSKKGTYYNLIKNQLELGQ